MSLVIRQLEVTGPALLEHSGLCQVFWLRDCTLTIGVIHYLQTTTVHLAQLATRDVSVVQSVE
jgi:hypothetical protein